MKIVSKIYRGINYILNLPKINNKIDFAFDEKIKDYRDFVGGPNLLSFNILPDLFILDDKRFQHQGASYDCTAYSCTNAINTENWYKAVKNIYYTGKQLADVMRKNGTMTPKGAFVIDAIKTAKDLGRISGYYQVNSILEIMNAIYRGNNPVCTGTEKINWTKIKNNGLVKEVSSGGGHGICIIGWDKNKNIGNFVGAICLENSYSEKWGDNGKFWIPFNLVDKILFNTKKAIIVEPNWTKMKQEELLKLSENKKNKKKLILKKN